MEDREAHEIAENYFKHLQRAQLLMEVARWRDALHEYNQHLAKFPDDYGASCNSALCHLELQEYQSAFDATARAIATEPEDEWAYRLQANIFIANGENKRALDAAKLCIEKSPESPVALYCLFSAQVEYGSLVEAEATLKLLSEKAAGSPDLFDAAGYLALKQGKYLESEKHYLEALRLNPESVNSLNNLGVVYLTLAQKGHGKHYQQKSIELFERAVKLEPTFKLAQNNISTASNAIKVGFPVGLVFLIWIGLRMAGSLSSSIASASRDPFATSRAMLTPVTNSYVLTGTNFYLIGLLLIAFVATVAAIAMPQHRKSLLYELTTVRGWLLIFSLFVIAATLYVVGLWVIGGESTTFTSFGILFSIVVSFFAGINLLKQWRRSSLAS